MRNRRHITRQSRRYHVTCEIDVETTGLSGEPRDAVYEHRRPHKRVNDLDDSSPARGVALLRWERSPCAIAVTFLVRFAGTMCAAASPQRRDDYRENREVQ
jgi:hypothetical protein